MSGELETRLEDAFTAQAATTTTSDDAWARIQRRATTRDHRRSVVLRAVAAAVVGLLVVGGGVALFRDRGEPGTVATGSDASKSGAEDSASSVAPSVDANGVAEGASPVRPFVESGTDGPVVVFGPLRLDVGVANVEPLLLPIPAVAGDGVVLGVAPAGTATVLIAPDAGPVELYHDPSLGLRLIFLARSAARGETVHTIEARDASGRLLGRGEVNGG